ncbi:MAG: MFS transporter [Muribaculaceae bacterium]|nr:MFS transporter [Muribaculaceae bacterium]
MGNASGIRTKLIIMNFLEFAVWGSYLVSMGIYLGSVGLGANIFWFYTMQGIVSLFMPALVGIIADKWIPAQKMLAGCQGLAGLFMLLAGFYCMSAGTPHFPILFTLYALSIAFYMPTIGLANSVAFNALNNAGLDTVKNFPPIRVWGTVGFICAELFVNFTGFQSSYMQFITSGFMSLVLMCYAVTMPDCPINKSSGASLAESLGLNAFKLFKSPMMAVFFIFSFLLGVCLQITNSYGTTFINSFQYIADYANDWAARNATALTAVSQASEALCILLIPFCLKKFGIKGVMLTAMFAWVLRFGFFGIGNTGSGVIFLVLSCIVYGVAFDFFNVAGGLFVDQQTTRSIRSSAQGLFMIMTNGLGASVGTWVAGTYVINRYVDMSAEADAAANLSGWQTSWFIFAAYALVISILFIFLFRSPKKQDRNISFEEAETIGGGDPEGMPGINI